MAPVETPLPEACPNTTFSGYLTLTEVSHRLPRRNGKRVNVSTIYRWTRNLRGVRLEHWRMGRTVVTTEAALQKFFTDLAKVDFIQTSSSHKPRKPKRRQTPEYRQKSIDEANAILRRAKIIA